MQRADSGVWLYPTGWADVGYSPAEVAVKEVREETGIECVPEGVVAVLDGMRMGMTRIPLYSTVFLCRATGGELQAHPLETRDVGWFAEDELPEWTIGAAAVGCPRLRGDPRRAAPRAVRPAPGEPLAPCRRVRRMQRPRSRSPSPSARGSARPSEVLDACLAEVAAGNERLNAFVHLDEEQARAAAEAVDAAVARGRRPRPVRRRALRREGPRRLRRHAHQPRVARLQAGQAARAAPPTRSTSPGCGRAGGVPIGKTAAPEFGTLNFTKTKAWGITRNPWDPSRTPGGSSGGSAAAVAAGLVPVATASDGGGSTRIPAGFSGLVGLKPSHGRIPHPGPSGSQTAVHGMLTTTVADSARHLDITAGPHDDDRLSLPADGRRYEELIESLPVAGLRARWSVDLGFVEHVDPDVARLAEAAATALVGAAGLELDGKDVAPHRSGRAHLAWLQRRRHGPLVLHRRGHVAGRRRRPHALLARLARGDRRLPGAASTPARCAVASSSRSTRRGSSPRSTCCSRPPPRCRRSRPRARRRAARMATPFTMLANLCWNPSISVPAGLTPDGLPVGLQITVAPPPRRPRPPPRQDLRADPSPGPGTRRLAMRPDVW